MVSFFIKTLIGSIYSSFVLSLIDSPCLKLALSFIETHSRGL